MPQNPVHVHGLPKGIDQRAFKQFLAKSAQDRAKVFAAEHRTWVRNGKLQAKVANRFAGSVEADRAKVERAAGQTRADLKKLAAEKPPKLDWPPAPNPSRFGLYDFTWSQLDCGGISSCRLYGPIAASGYAGVNLFSGLGGSASGVSSVGIAYVPASSYTMTASVQATCWFRGAAASFLFGYGQAYAGLRVYVEQYTPFRAVYATTDIIDIGGVVAVNFAGLDDSVRTASITLPVRAGVLYIIWADTIARVHGYGLADATSNFACGVHPISFT